MVRIDKFLGDGRHVREDPEPAEGIDTFVLCDLVLGNAGARGAMIAVATGDEIALDLVPLAMVRVANARPAAVEIADGDVLRFPDEAAARGATRIGQVLLDLGLPIDHEPAAGKSLQIDAVRAAVVCELDAVVRQALAHHPGPDAGLVQQIDRAPLEQSSAYARLDVLARLALEHDGFDAAGVQQLRQQQPGRTCADDGDLESGHCSSFLPSPRRGYPKASDSKESRRQGNGRNSLEFVLLMQCRFRLERCHNARAGNRLRGKAVATAIH